MTNNYWDRVWQAEPLQNLSPKIFAHPDPCDEDFLDLIGNVSGKTVLDLGCGNGELSVYLAGKGGIVTAVDSSIYAVNNTMSLAKRTGVAIKTEVLDAQEITKLNTVFDLIVGRFILHHLENFASFVPVLNRMLKPQGRAVFLENNSRNKLLMLFRHFLVGRFGIPKHGDNKEYPLSASKIDLLRRSFTNTAVTYPKLMLFDLIGVYLFSRRHGIRKFFRKTDDAIYPFFPFLGKYGYRQLVEIKK